MRAPGNQRDFCASAADTLKGGHPAPYGVPALAGTVLPLEGGSIRCKIQNEVACDRLKPGLHTLHKPTPVVESGPFSFRDQIFGLKPGLRAFTLLELLIVLAIIGFLSAIALPHLRGLTRSNVMAGANEQLLGDLALARQRAINSRSVVCIVFMPAVDPNSAPYSSNPNLQNQILLRQYTSYTLFAERSVGDQPGRPFKRYLREWKALPDGVFLATNKFSVNYAFTNANGEMLSVLQFDYKDFPYPTNDSPNTLSLAYIAFDPQGHMISFDAQGNIHPYKSNPNRPGGIDKCVIPLARGSIFLDRDPVTRDYRWVPAQPSESGGNNSQDPNSYNQIVIDTFTGRAVVDRRSL